MPISVDGTQRHLGLLISLKNDRLAQLKMTHPQLQVILAKLRRHLKATYSDRLVSLILFGSQARGEADINSDIDVLIVLNEPFDIPQERKRLSQFLAQLCLDYDTLITCVWADVQDWRARQSPLLINIRREGIVVN